MCAPIRRNMLVAIETIHGVLSMWMTGNGRRDIRLLECLMKLRGRVKPRLLIDCGVIIWRDTIYIVLGLVGLSTATHRGEVSGAERREGRHRARRRLSTSRRA